MFKFIFKLIVLIVLLVNCSDIERDNLLDPKNSDSYSETPILIEAFVNVYFDYDRTALYALEQIEAEFGDQVDIEIVEYHRDHDDAPDGEDQYENPRYTELHRKYANTFELGSIAIPDIYVNGSLGRVKGASDFASVYNRLAPIITDIAGQQSQYALEVDLETSGNQLNVDYRVARLGNESEENLELHIIFVKDYENPSARHIVDQVTYPDAEAINKIEAGEYFEGSNSISCPNYPDYALFTITRQGNITVLKTLKRAISW